MRLAKVICLKEDTLSAVLCREIRLALTLNKEVGARLIQRWIPGGYREYRMYLAARE
jgi:hypothetical protein